MSKAVFGGESFDEGLDGGGERVVGRPHARPNGVSASGRANLGVEDRPQRWVLTKSHVRVPFLDPRGRLRRMFQDGDFGGTLRMGMDRMDLEAPEAGEASSA